MYKKMEEFLKKPKNDFIMVTVLLLIGIFIRAYHFGQVPTGINQDEAMLAVDAKALADYGTDRFGTRYPVHLKGWEVCQMSVLLSYCMIPFIKILGFSVTAIRLPMLIISCIGLLMLYLCAKEIGGNRTGLITLFLGVICPWHYMQSRWSLDCNMFPHMFLISMVFLMWGMRKRKWLYLSMFFFGLCSYCYGVANYSVPLFLLAAAVYLLHSKRLTVRELIWCIVIYLLTASLEFATMFVNIFKLKTIETPLFTIPRFSNGVREGNVLFMNFSWEQLWKNICSMVQSVLGRGDYALSNNMPAFGPVFFITIPFFLLGFILLIKKMHTEALWENRYSAVFIFLWLCMGIWIGIVTQEVTVHRINVIYYAVLLIASIGISWCIEKCKYIAVPVFAAYSVFALLFARTYFGEWAKLSRTYYYYDVYVEALNFAKTIPCDYYYIFSDPQGDGNSVTGEIITMFCHDIDAEYYQGITNIQDGAEMLPYNERYHFETVTEETIKENEGKSVVYLVRQEEAALFSEEEYDICNFYDAYYVISPLYS